MSIKIIKNNNELLNIHDEENKKLGFWIYLMSDFVIFAILILTYMILSPHSFLFKKNFFNLPFVLIETIVLLLSSFSYSFIFNSMRMKNIKSIIKWMICTFILGFIFVFMEAYEFIHLIKQNYIPQKNAFLSSFFTLIGTHGIHIISGLLWMLILIFQIIYKGLTKLVSMRIFCLSMFWHFLDIIWIIIFSVVYLMGSL